MDFVSLHTHTTYSYADGFGMPADHCNRVADLGMGAVAFTEHGNLHSMVKLYQAAKAAGIKPIYGLEAYTAPSNMRETKNTRKGHQTILAADQQGHQNLMQLVTASWDQGFYRWPTVTSKSLWEHAEGLIVTSGCADSLLSMTLLGGKWIETGDERAAEPGALRAVHARRRRCAGAGRVGARLRRPRIRLGTGTAGAGRQRKFAAFVISTIFVLI